MPAIKKIATHSLALVFGFAGFLAAAALARAAEPGCGQKLVDGASPPSTSSYIYPRQPLQPFYQWENNDGYCGEVSMMQAGLNNGQWMSQFNARLICGTGLSQSGPSGACAAHRGQVDYNAQLLIEDPGTGVSGPNIYANAAQCLANSRLAATTYDYPAQTPGMAGYEDYMSWVKQEVIAGHQVTMAVLLNGGSDPQYDHEVAVVKIGTNHSPADPSYYPDDVVFFDDHGVYTLSGSTFTSNPAVPPGAGTDSTGCTPFVFGYTFASLANTRAGANLPAAQAYSIVIPGDRTIHTYTGGSGYDTVPIAGPHNYGFSVAGPQDPAAETLPVGLTIVGPTVTEGSMNPLDPVAGYDYENPMIGTSVWGQSCTNTPPTAWMTNFVLQVTVSSLTPGVAYNLYEYEFSSVEGVGSAAALAVPVENFNANAGLAAHVTTFTAVGSVYRQTVTTTSGKIVVFRCVPVSAP
ncbi:MAG TPA: hypothetical protein VN924_14780 [Bryobacteraceae bacterium]|nr:hypothetical protein [Bryobacteraceae bacterium]